MKKDDYRKAIIDIINSIEDISALEFIFFFIHRIKKERGI